MNEDGTGMAVEELLMFRNAEEKSGKPELPLSRDRLDCQWHCTGIVQCVVQKSELQWLPELARPFAAWASAPR